MRRDDRMRKARAWFTAQFKVKSWDELQKLAPVGTDENASYRMVVTYWDMVASFNTTAAYCMTSCSFKAAAKCCWCGSV